MKLSDKQKDILAKLFYWWTLIVVITPNIILSFTEPVSIWGKIANTLLPAGLWWLCLSLSRKVGRTSLFMFPLMFFAAFQIVLLDLYGRSVIAVDMFLNLLTTNPAEAGELLGNMIAAVFLVIIMFVPPIIGAIYCCVKKIYLHHSFILRFRIPAFVVAVAGIISLILAYSTQSGYAIENDLFPVNVIYNVKLAVCRGVKMSKPSNSKFTHFAYADSARNNREVYVLVIGETSRADHWQLNGYDRPTNPELNDSAFISFPKTLSESNTTHKSVPMLLSHLTSENFEDSIYYVKSIITAFKEAGYRTAFFSNQRYNHSFIDQFGFEADTTLFVKEMPGADSNPSDLVLIDYLNAEIDAGNGKQLIVLHSYGSHFSYADRYEGVEPVFQPDYPLQASKSHRKELVNAYDNSIILTSKLLSRVSSKLDSLCCPAALIYTSDHGEDIFDDDRNLFLHASPVPSIYQIHVPFILWFNREYSDTYPHIIKAAEANKIKNVSSSSAFAQTAFSIAGIKSAVSDSTASVVSRSYIEPKRMYLTDHNVGLPLKRIGMRDIDFEILDSLQISAD
ncbi:MAG: lipid A phosphoethanolamine transferase [Paramuribaculum sp.]|nr:lipid A phosphoethanolamine transferase [Paramuribaculum sp.]